jgi:23S rRNA pseudouridine2605 synthase
MNPNDPDPMTPVAPAPGEPSSADAPSAAADAAPAPGDASAPDGGDDNQRRRNRNRRRGRRNRGERAGGPEEQGIVVDIDNRALADDDDDDDGGTDADAAGEQPAAPQWTPVDVGERFTDVVTGAYDNEPPPEPEGEPAKRVLAAMPDSPKLHKVLAQSGIGSRRDMEQLITDGQITVNGQAAHIGQRVTSHDDIRISGKPVRVRIHPPPARVLAYHKPAGEIVTHGDPENRPTVFRRLPRLHQGKWQSVGRLDINTEGLLLFTNSGDLANRLMHPRFGVEREYAVRVLGTLSDEQREQLLEGVDIDGQRAAMRSIDDGGGEGANHWYRVVITEGRNREVRRMFESLGMAVSRLIRIRYGCVVLPRGLRRGVWVELPESDLRTLQTLTGGARPPQQHPQGGNNGKGNNDRNKRRRGRGGRDGDAPRAGPGPGQEPRRDDDDNDTPDFASIPNPLQQTFDHRAIREARQPRREISEDGPIPNPLEQTYDKRFVQKPRGIGGGGGSGRKGGKGGGGGERQPDPMQTSVGYIGADAFHKQMSGGGGGGRGRRRR